MSDEQRDPSWDADPATPEQMQLVERVCTGLGFEGYFDTTCGWWRNEWNRPVFVPVVRSIALAYELGRLDQSDLRNAAPRSQPEEVPADGYVTITTNEAGECVAVTRNDVIRQPTFSHSNAPARAALRSPEKTTALQYIQS